LLNAIFRGFHTVKGGAGFLQLGAMVDCCHVTENLFDILRNGKQKVSPALMDTVLQALDAVNVMFDSVKQRQPPTPAPVALLEALSLLAKAEQLERSQSDTHPAVLAEDLPSDEITEDEFEALLDQLHGAGVHKGVPTAEVVLPPSPPAAAHLTSAASVSSTERASGLVKKTSQPLRAAAVPERVEAKEPAAEPTVRVDTRRLDEIMNMVGELVLVRNRLIRIGSNSSDEALSKAVANLDLVTADLQTSVMKARMQPIKKVFGRFPRVVRDLARSLNKEVILKLQGEETDLDKNLVEALADPLVHLVRNAVDHGIE
jgi:two-component system chemotaxis sensor kinase CheA